jgi:hypothetical protein
MSLYSSGHQGILPLVAATVTVVTVLLLLVQRNCCSWEISAYVVGGGGMIAGNGDHVIQSQFICVGQASELVPQQSSPL